MRIINLNIQLVNIDKLDTATADEDDDENECEQENIFHSDLSLINIKTEQIFDQDELYFKPAEPNVLVVKNEKISFEPPPPSVSTIDNAKMFTDQRSINLNSLNECIKKVKLYFILI